jgi:chemotaxis signal transduction protein
VTADERMVADTSASAEAMRRRFDASFAEPPRPTLTESTPFLSIRLGGDAFVLRVREVTGLAPARRIIALPGSAPAMLGLSGLRGHVVAVFSLSLLMGYRSETPRWLAMCAGEGTEGVALAFGEFEGYLELPAADVRTTGPAEPRREAATLVREYVAAAGQLRGVIDLASVVKGAYATVARPDMTKER